MVTIYDITSFKNAKYCHEKVYFTCEVVGDWGDLDHVLWGRSQTMDFTLRFCWLWHSDLFENSAVFVQHNDIIVVNLAGIGTVQVPVDIKSGDASFGDDKVVNWNIGGICT